MKIKTYIITIAITLILSFLLAKFVKWDVARTNGASYRCKINCGETNYDCRNKCFSYEYYN